LGKHQSTQKKQAIVQAWKNRRIGVTQAVFCAEHGIGSTRSLRNILYQYATPEVPVERARAILGRTIQELTTLFDSISEVSNELPVEPNFGSVFSEQRNGEGQMIRTGGIASEAPPIEIGTKNHLPVGNTQVESVTVVRELPRGDSDRQSGDPQGKSVEAVEEVPSGENQSRRSFFWDLEDEDENVS
jgi:hypothetical protein